MSKKGIRILIAILIIVIIGAGALLAYKIMKNKNNDTQEVSDSEEEEILTAEVKNKDIQIFKGTDRPIAVMIDNHKQAWPQAGLNKAYLV